MAKQTVRHDIQDGLYIYQQDNSDYWYARFVVDGTWYAKATRKKDQKDAVHAAIELKARYRLQLDNDIPIQRTQRASKYLFPRVAELAIERMESETAEGSGKTVYEGYAQALNKYHKEFFAKTPVMNIGREQLREFDSWRIENLGRVPARSTILNHNAAVNRVFDEAVIRKYMVQSQVPALENMGAVGERRASFTELEFKHLVDAAYEFAREARTGKSRMIRELLVDYIVVAAHTGIRPGTEMEEIRWGDISIRRENELMALYISVRKGKTTAYTGPRKVVCRDGVLIAFLNLQDTFPDRKPTDKVFVLQDGSETKHLGRSFSRLLRKSNMEVSPEGKRTLYSLRHSYITWQLQRKVPIQVLANQCGTSIKMLEEYYSHVVPEMFTRELSGSPFSNPSDVSQRLDPAVDQEGIDLTNQFIDEWENEINSRGCI